MKRILKYFKYLLIVPLFFALYTLSSCTIEDRVVSIEVISNGETAYSSTGLNYDNYSLKVVYDGGKEEKQDQTLLIVNKLDVKRKESETQLAISDYYTL